MLSGASSLNPVCHLLAIGLSVTIQLRLQSMSTWSTRKQLLVGPLGQESLSAALVFHSAKWRPVCEILSYTDTQRDRLPFRKKVMSKFRIVISTRPGTH
jgi:hypothetical protein